MKSHRRLFMAASAAFLFVAAPALAQGTVTSVGTGGGLTGGPITTSGTVSIDPGVYNPITNYGVTCSGADESTAIQAAINALPAQNGVLDIPMGCLAYYGTTLDGKGKNYVQLRGVSPKNGGPATNVSGLVYTGTGARGIDLRDTAGWVIDKLWLNYTNPGFAGFIIDAGGVTSGSSVSSNFTLTDSFLGPFGSVTTPVAGCLLIDQAIEVTIKRNNFSGCAGAIHGELIAGFSNVVHIEDNQFVTSYGPPIRQCGESWLLENNTFEPDSNGRASAFANSPSLPCRGMVSIGNWYGDVTTNGGEWWVLTAIGFTAIGDRMYATAGANVGYDLTGGSGYSWRGGSYDSFSLVIGCGSSPTGLRLENLTTTNISSGVVQSGCLDVTAENNTPNVSYPLPTWTPVLAPSSGSITYVINNAEYKRSGNTTEFWVTASIATNTGGAGALIVSGLPVTLAAHCAFSGFDGSFSLGLSGYGSGGSTAASIFRSNNNYPGVAGAVLFIYASCQTL
jgi:hypothetical protein